MYVRHSFPVGFHSLPILFNCTPWAAAINPSCYLVRFFMCVSDVLAQVWSLFTLLTPWAAAIEYLPLLLGVRALMGLGEGVAFPIIQVSVQHPTHSVRSVCMNSAQQISHICVRCLTMYV
jgi:hypothetical protein